MPATDASSTTTFDDLATLLADWKVSLQAQVSGF
jgi:hypothetical protein